MTRKEYKKAEIRLMISETDEDNAHYTWSFPIRCPYWLFKMLLRLEK